MTEPGALVNRYLVADSADDLMRHAIELLQNHGDMTRPTRGDARELRGMCLELTNPRARLSRSEARGRVFSALAELCWYLARSDDVEHIAYYLSMYWKEAEEDNTVHAAYGPRLFDFDGTDQIQNVIATLSERPFSRQAIIQVFHHADIESDYKHVPCTCTLQYLLRDGRLDAVTYMRSNDAVKGLAHDLFAFTMLQEMIARSLEVELGTYIHMVGSLHLYESDKARAEQFLSEGWFATVPMPPMPEADPWNAVEWLTATERAMRTGEVDPSEVVLDADPYWQDLARLLAVFVLEQTKRLDAIPTVRRQMTSRVYDVFLDDRYGVL